MSNRVIASILRALAGFLGALLLVFSLVFLAVGVLPVDPARSLLGPLASEEAVDRARVDLSLDVPLAKRYVAAVSRALRGDFGQSFFYKRPALDIVLDSAPVTFSRVLGALVLGCAFGVALALAGASFRVPGVRLLLGLAQGAPAFCMMVSLLWLAGTGLGATPLGDPWLFEILIVVGAGLYPAGSVGIYLLERLDPSGPRSPLFDFLVLLHAPLRERSRLLGQAALPGVLLVAVNALLPTVTGISFGEIVFNLDGFGLLFFRSCERGDVAVVATGTLLLATLALSLQRGAESLIRRVDPRVLFETP